MAFVTKELVYAQKDTLEGIALLSLALIPVLGKDFVIMELASADPDSRIQIARLRHKMKII
jgi:hypothetical protein